MTRGSWGGEGAAKDQRVRLEPSGKGVAGLVCLLEAVMPRSEGPGRGAIGGRQPFPASWAECEARAPDGSPGRGRLNAQGPAESR